MTGLATFIRIAYGGIPLPVMDTEYGKRMMEHVASGKSIQMLPPQRRVAAAFRIQPPMDDNLCGGKISAIIGDGI